MRRKKPCEEAQTPVRPSPALRGAFAFVGGPLDGQSKVLAVAHPIYVEVEHTYTDSDGTRNLLQHTYVRRGSYYLFEPLMECMGNRGVFEPGGMYG